MTYSILTPAIVLVLWSIIMLFWMVATRLPAMRRIGVGGSSGRKPKPGGRGQDLDGVVPDNVQWKAHNFTNLMEQPTLYYATVLILAVSGGASQLMVGFAWGYTILRIAHSIWQATVNIIFPVRFTLYLLATICLIVLAVGALVATITMPMAGAMHQ